MKKYASIILALAMAAILPMNQVMASEITLDSAISNLQYGLTVEWDQKDSAIQKKVLAGFVEDVDALKRQGVTDEQIFNALSAKAFDAQTAKDLAQLAKYAKAKKLSQEKTRKLIVDYANKSQKLGTSWSSEATTALIVGLIIAVLIVAAATGNLSVAVVGDATGCTYYDDCYYDMWGDYYCDTYCY